MMNKTNNKLLNDFLGTNEDLNFESFDDIMKVVCKIENGVNLDLRGTVDMSFCQCKISTHTKEKYFHNISNVTRYSLVRNKLEAVYKTIVEYVNWYNEENINYLK